MKHSTYMQVARDIANGESKCVSRRVGAVIVNNDHIVSTGYNGTPSGHANCCDVNAHLLTDPSVLASWKDHESRMHHHHWSKNHELHAEHNAILYAGRDKCEGATLYCTLQPCNQCAVLIAGVGIKRVIYDEAYEMTEETNVLQDVEVIKLSDLPPDAKF